MKIGIQLFRSNVFGRVYYEKQIPGLDLLLCDMFSGTYQGCANAKRMKKQFQNYSNYSHKISDLNGVWDYDWFIK